MPKETEGFDSAEIDALSPWEVEATKWEALAHDLGYALQRLRNETNCEPPYVSDALARLSDVTDAGTAMPSKTYARFHSAKSMTKDQALRLKRRIQAELIPACERGDTGRIDTVIAELEAEHNGALYVHRIGDLRFDDTGSLIGDLAVFGSDLDHAP